MKIAHFADCHLGYRAGRSREDGTNLRELDGYMAFEEAVDGMIEEKVDVVVLAGDLFHSPEPSVKSFREASRILQKFPKETKIYCITGNHDTFDNKTVPSAVTPLNIPEMNIYTFEEPYRLIEIEEVALHLVSHHNFGEQDETMEKLVPVEGKVNILVSHGSIYDETIEEVLSSNMSPREVIIPQEVLDKGWDLILLGHIHKRQKVGKNAYYSGSLLRRGWADPEGDRGWILWEVSKETIERTDKNVWQRAQEETIIDCHALSTVEIEEVVKEFLIEITTDYDRPIARVTLDRISLDKKHTINWKQFNELTSKCLTFSTKYNIEDLEVTTTALEEAASSRGTIEETFKDFWEVQALTVREEIREETREEMVEFIKQGKEEVLNEE